MMFLQAFLVGGLLCFIFQVALMTSRLDVPKLLVIGLALGAIGSAFGLCDILASFGGAGFSIMVIGAAQALFNAFMALFTGNWLPICAVVGVLAVLTVLGLATGWAYSAVHRKSSAKATLEAA